MPKGEKFTCGLCGNEFKSLTTMEEINQEYLETHGEPLPENPDEIVSVCDTCWDIYLQEARELGNIPPTPTRH